jgi:hypothetical protein
VANDWTYFPQVMTAHDLQTMRTAVQLALKSGSSPDGLDGEQIACIVYRYYERGLMDPEKLAAAASFLSSSRLFQPREAVRE